MPKSPGRSLYFAAAALSLVSIMAISVYFGRRDTFMIDFSQYYAGALVARSGDWAGLYPEPLPGGEWNAGSKISARPNPKYMALSTAEGVVPEHNFIQPPATAILYSPLAWFRYQQAEWIWRILTGFAVWGTAIFSGRIARHLSGSQLPTIPEILTVAIICMTPNRIIAMLAYGNVSSIVGLAIAAGVYFVLKNRLRGGALWLGLATILKISPATLLVSALLIRGVRGFVPWLLLLAGLLLASITITGVEPWHVFVTEIAPTLKRPWLPGENDSVCTLSIYGLAYRILQLNPLPQGVIIGLKALSFAVMGGVALLWWLKREAISTDDRAALAALSSATVVPLIFAPLTWPHYSFFLVVFTGWILFECANSAGFDRVLPAIILPLLYIPRGWLLGLLGIPALGDMSYTLAYALMMVMSLRILLRRVAVQDETNPVTVPRNLGLARA